MRGAGSDEMACVHETTEETKEKRRPVPLLPSATSKDHGHQERQRKYRPSDRAGRNGAHPDSVGDGLATHIRN